ncbi:MAG TPA: hypothetical protein VHG30_05025 [Microvirga sp.]|nr:hypothetical protein [Microvirga sp.]
MPVLDAKALKTDREGLAFLRAVLAQGSSRGAAGRKPSASRPDPAQRAPGPAEPAATGRPAAAMTGAVSDPT